MSYQLDSSFTSCIIRGIKEWNRGRIMSQPREAIELAPEIKKHAKLFNWIAPLYNLFFDRQVKRYRENLVSFHSILELPERGEVLDLGCGTGALLSAFAELGYWGTGVDIAPRMLEMAKRSTQGRNLEFIQADITQGLPFPDQRFDIVTSSYVLHGVSRSLRQVIYREARRIARQQVLFFDYNSSRRLLTEIVEWAEGGDYFNFIRTAEEEIREAFPQVSKHSINPYAAIYQCKV